MDSDQRCEGLGDGNSSQSPGHTGLDRPLSDVV